MKVSATHLATRVRFGFDYLLHLPRGYSATRGPRWPLVVFFHGKGERGHDLSLVQRHGPPKRVAAGHAFPFILAAPQCAENEWWNYGALDAWVLELMRRHRVDSSRVYLTGLSMGGFATWGLAQLNPQRYAAVAPICGGGEVRRAEVLRDLPIWAFHGALDQAIPLQRSREMILAVKAAGGSPRFTIYPKAGHDSWTKPYAGKALYAWLLSHRRK
ncbi:MAG: Alpha/beta hydrolase family protein [Verrucomicrobia bacterium]|nr:Alpha/beta hydrolase family protein [Verrucomicrobiota bacterium]